MKVAYETATLSPDPSNQNGALIVQSNGIILSRSCNFIPRGAGTTPKLLAYRDWKIPRIAHAEEASIIVAARLGIATEYKTMICPWAPCLPCARMINIAGINKLVIHTRRMETTPERWKESVNDALRWLTNVGIEIVWLADSMPEAPKINVNGELWQP